MDPRLRAGTVSPRWARMMGSGPKSFSKRGSIPSPAELDGPRLWYRGTTSRENR